MQYARLGNTGLIVSRLSFGVMTFGSASGDDSRGSVWKIAQDEADRLMHHALDTGINFFDTADMYAAGQSEEMLARALGSRRKDVVISTKIGFRSGDAVTQTGASFRYILQATEASLRRLKTDYIDLLSIHKPDPFTPFEESARALDNLVTRGLVRYVGYSNFNAWQAAKFLGIQKQHNYSPFVAAQMYYSLVGRDIEHEVAPFCQDAGIAIVVWSPLAGGFLTGRYTRQDPTGGKGRLASFDMLPHDKEKGYDLIERMQDVGQRYKASVAQVALAWLLSKSFVTTILVGASRLSQLENNLAASDLEIAAEDLAALDALTEPAPIYPNWFQKLALDSTASDALKIGLHPAPAEVKA
ncbi:MAG TPA: aldo/keto reductase [Terriglobales bacterium]|nr:aldo/keto reductase [Terriglobales bacterium]